MHRWNSRLHLLHPTATVLIVAAALISFAAATTAYAADTAPRPNVVLIMADDMGWSDIGCYGGEIQTPNLDRLANNGMRFTQFYNNAKCTTTRASLVTGLYPRRDGSLLKTNMVTLGEVMQASGYRTSLSGKWHLGDKEPLRPIDRGFENFYGLLDGCCNFFDPAQPDPDFKNNKVRVWADGPQRVTQFPEGFYTTDAITDHAARMIDQYSQDERPFFVHVCYTAPHYPLHAKPADIAKYQGRYRDGWQALRNERYQRQLQMGLIDPSWELPPHEQEVTDWDKTANQEWEQRRMEVYAAMVDCMDQGIGRIVQALKDAGEYDNTLIMFLSDNGGCAETLGGVDTSKIPGPKEYYTACGPGWAFAQNTPFRRYKAWVHEGGSSTPLVIHWPGHVEPGAITHQVGHIIDVLPTLLDVAGGEYPSNYNGQAILPVEGTTMAPIFAGQTREPHDILFWEWAGNRAVRKGDWKLSWDGGRKRWELYNLKADRTEMHDLSTEQPDRVDDLSSRWLAWAKQTGVSLKDKKKGGDD